MEARVDCFYTVFYVDCYERPQSIWALRLRWGWKAVRDTACQTYVLSSLLRYCRVEVVEDTKIPNAATIKILKQDHTLGNMLRAYAQSDSIHEFDDSNLLWGSQLLAMPQILFAGYKVPHPLQPYFLIKIQTDGSVTPTEILEQACTKLIGTMASLEAKFKREFQFKDVDGAVVEDAYGTVTTGATWTEGRDYMDF